MGTVTPIRERRYTAAEVGVMLRVTRKTVQRWAREGKLQSDRTSCCGRRVFRESDVEALLRGES